MQFSTLTAIPVLMLLSAVVLLVRYIRHRSFAHSPELCCLILVFSIRCIFYLFGMWGATRIMFNAFPFFMLLAAEESLRHFVTLADERSRFYRYRFCLSIGVVMACVSLMSSNAAAPLRAALQVASCGMLAASLLHGVMFNWGMFTDSLTRKTQWLLFFFFAAALVSSRLPVGAGWWVPTLITECVQLAVLIGLQWVVP